MSKHKAVQRVEQLPAKTTVGDLTLIVNDLVVAYNTRDRYLWWPSGRQEGEHRQHTTSARGLLQQLADAAGVRDDDPQLAAVTAAQAHDEGGHSKPGSRPPTGAMFVDEYARLVTEIWDMRRRLAKEQHITWLPGGPPGEVLADICNLAVKAPDWQQEQALRAARSWSSACRVALQYEAPWIAMKAACPDCGGVLKVRRDATSDVWCRGGPGVWLDVPWSLEWIADTIEMGCGNKWPRSSWVALLNQLGGDQQVTRDDQPGGDAA